MIKNLKLQLFRMAFALLLLVTLGLWQYDFVITAINSNVFLNMTIFGTFAFGAFLMYRDVFRLENEVHAFEALKEEYEDTRNVEEKTRTDPLWRYYRCNDLARIYQKPNILGHAHQLISEQIARNRALVISPSTIATLMDGIDNRLSDQKSLQQYVTGILIFLGLIGTFVGLMGTLSSVGDILGSLNLDSGDAAAMVANLMDDLKAPLKGMATGFSSSLFGLVTSLTLGVMGRFAANASNDLRINFEGWLSSIAQIEENATAELNADAMPFGTINVTNADGEELKLAANNSMERQQLELLYRVARHSMTTNGRLRSQLNKLTKSVQILTEENAAGRKTSTLLAENLLALAEQHHGTNKLLQQQGLQLQQQGDQLRSNDDLRDLLSHMEDRAHDRQERMRERIETLSSNLDILATGSHADQAEREEELEAAKVLNALDAELQASRSQRGEASVLEGEQPAQPEEELNPVAAAQKRKSSWFMNIGELKSRLDDELPQSIHEEPAGDESGAAAQTEKPKQKIL